MHLDPSASLCQWMPEKIGKYEVECELGRGGFGRVFRARDPDVKRLVAVKILAIDNDSELLSRFRAEAKAAGNLQHKNIVTIYEYGEAEGIPYIAMEYLEGQTLQETIARSAQIPLATKLRLMAEVADGLHYAHQHGVVHRDVKPANIVVLPGGGVKIVDFGIARLVQSATQAASPAEYVTGTLRYLSPEQCDGLEADALSDIFAYGVIYYELLTGRHPFEAEEAPAILYKIRCEEPEPLSGIPESSAAVIGAVISRALAKERDVRYPSLEELRLDAEPLRLELERQQAQTLLAEAESLTAAERYEEARNLVHEVLLFDPSNRAARQMRTRLRQLEQEHALHLRMNALVREGEERLRERRYDEAVNLLQAALQCDPADEDIKLRLSRAVSARERAQQLTELKKGARQERERGELTVALQTAGKALQLDAHDDETLALLDEIQHAMEEAESRKRRREQLDRAKGLLLLGDLEAAEAALKQIRGERCAESDEMLAQIAAQKAERERRVQLKEELAGIRNLLGRFRFDEALPWLESLVEEWPEEEEPRKLQAYAREEAARQQRAQAVEDVKRRAKSMLGKGEYQAAMDLLEQGCRDHPGSAEMLQLLKTAGEQKAAAEREKAFEDAQGQIACLRREQNLAAAIRLAESVQQQYGESEQMQALSRQLAQEWEAWLRREAVRRALDNARELIGHGQARTAISLLKRISAEHPEDAEIAELLKRAEQTWVNQQREAALDKLSAEARELAEAGEHERALKLAAAAMEEYPGDPRLEDLARFLEESKQEAERAQAIRRGLRQCERFDQEGRLDDALAVVLRLIVEHGERPQLIAEKGRIEQAIERDRREREAGERAEAQRAVDAVIAAARELENQGKEAAALQAIELATLRYPDSDDLARAEQQLRERMAGAARRKRVKVLKMDIEIQLHGQQYEAARKKLAAAEAEFPGESEWDGLRRRLDGTATQMRGKAAG